MQRGPIQQKKTTEEDAASCRQSFEWHLEEGVTWIGS